MGHHQPNVGAEVQIESFLKLNPPSFSGNPLTDDPQQYIDCTNKVLRILRCLSERAGELVAYNLNGPVEQWYPTLLEGRDASDLPSFTWEEFTEIFMVRFLPVIRERSILMILRN